MPKKNKTLCVDDFKKRMKICKGTVLLKQR